MWNDKFIVFSLSFNIVTVKRGGNRAGRFLEVAVQGEGAREGLSCCWKVVKGEDGVDSPGN
jgi:hypothetical protein